MTNIELRNNIPELVKDELCGAKKYFEMAKIMYDDGYHELAQIFRNMSHEEFSHAEYLKYLGEKIGIKFDIDNEFETTKKMIYDL